MQKVLKVTLIILNIANIFLHGIGAYILACLYHKGQPNPQKVFIIHLCVCELLINLFECFRQLFDFLPFTGQDYLNIAAVQNYMLIIMFTGISFVFYALMFYITLDRLLNILLNIKYKIYCHHRGAKYMLQVTWVVGLVISTTVSLTYHFLGFDWETVFFKCFYPILEFAFILIVLVTYVLIFRKYKQSLKLSCRQVKTVESRSNEFRVSRFCVPVLIILSFVVFMLLPDLIYLFYGVLGNNLSDTLSACCWISYAISNLIDGWVYIFMQKPVKLMLREKVLSCFHHSKPNYKNKLGIRRDIPAITNTKKHHADPSGASERKITRNNMDLSN